MRYLTLRDQENSIDMLKSIHCSLMKYIAIVFILFNSFYARNSSLLRTRIKKTTTAIREILALQMRGWCNLVHHPILTRIAALFCILSPLQIISEGARRRYGKIGSAQIKDDDYLDISSYSTLSQFSRIFTSVFHVIDTCNIREHVHDNYFTL